MRRHEGGAGAVDAPQAPESASGWDSRSEELLGDVALTPDLPSGGGLAPDLPGSGAPAPVTAHSVPAFGESASGATGATGEPGGPEAFGSGESVRPFGGHVSAPASAPRAKPPRRGAADPVKALMHRHRELCARAVDPLEIAAGLEAHGVTDRAAARFRHRDVFALAEEMYARVPRGGDDAGRTAPADEPAGIRAAGRAGSGIRDVPQAPPGWALFALLPGAVCAAAVTALGLGPEGDARYGIVPVGVLAVAVALRVALRKGPLRHVTHPMPATRAWACWLLAYALLGDALLSGAVSGGPDAPADLWDPALAPLLGLALAVAPATWCARLFAVRAGSRLAASRGLDDFASSVRPLLLGVFALFLAALGALLTATHALLGGAGGDLAGGTGGGARAPVGAAALGELLLLARLLGAYGFTRAPALLLGAAGAGEVAALALVFAGRLPGCDLLGAPVTAAVDAWGPGAVPALACGSAALVLLAHAARTLTLASAHACAREAP